MEVREVMARSTVCCGADRNAGWAVRFMHKNCGLLPVVDDRGMPQRILSMYGVVTQEHLNK